MGETGRQPESRVAIVTGGGSGIGLAISERLAADGMAVAVFDRDGEAAEQAAGKISAAGDRALGVTVDVTDRAQIDEAVAQVRREFGPPTVLVNNAGVHAVDPFLKIMPEKWQRLLTSTSPGRSTAVRPWYPTWWRMAGVAL